MGPRRRRLGLHGQARQLHRLPLGVHRHDALRKHPCPLRDRLPPAAGKDRRRHPGLPLLGRVLPQELRLGASGRFGGLEEPRQTRLFLRRARYEPRLLHARARHPARARAARRAAELLHLPLRRAEREGLQPVADPLRLPRPGSGGRDQGTGRRRALTRHYYFGSRISGRPVLELPISTTLALALVARRSVASMPFHSSNCGLIPSATMRWKSAMPCASMRFRSASCFSFCSTKFIRRASCSACCLASIEVFSIAGNWTSRSSTLSTMMPRGPSSLRSSSWILSATSSRAPV